MAQEPPSSESIDTLVVALGSESARERETAALRLVQYGQVGVLAITESVGSDNPDARRAAIEVLASIGAAANTAVPVIVRALDDPDESVRRSAINALRRVGPLGPETREPIEAALAEIDPRAGIRENQWGLQLSEPLLTWHPDSHVAINWLLEYADSDPWNLGWALSALALARRNGEPALELALAGLGNDSQSIRAEAASLLAAIGVRSEEVLEGLRAQAVDPNPATQPVSLRALGDLRDSHPSTVSLLERFLSADSEEVRRASAYALERLGAAAGGSVAALVRATTDSDLRTRLHAVRALDSLGAAPDGAAALVTSLSDGAQQVADAAEIALVRMAERDALGEEALARLVEAASGRLDYSGLRAVHVLSADPSPDSVLLTGLVAALNSRVTQVAQEAANALQRLDAEAVPLLVSSIRNSDAARFRSRALTVVDSIGRLDREVMPLLVELLDPTSGVAGQAEAMIARGHPDALTHLLSTARTTQGGHAQAIARILTGMGPPPEALATLGALLSDPRAGGWAALGLARAGGAAVPVVVEVLESANDPNASQVGLAAVVVDSLGSAAAAAAPALVAALDGYQGNVPDALLRIGSAAIPALIDGTTAASTRVRNRSAALLGQLSAVEALPALTAMLDDRFTGSAAREAIVEIGADSRELVLGGLRGASPSTAVLEALAELGVAVGEEIPAALTDSSVDVRRNAAIALGSLRPLPTLGRTGLLDALSDPAESVADAAVGSIVSVGLTFESALDSLTEDIDPLVRRRAVFALWRLGARTDSTEATLERLLDDPDARVRRVSATAVAAIRGPDGYGRALIPAVTDDAFDVRVSAAQQLRDLAIGYQDGGRVDQLSLVRDIEEVLQSSEDQPVFSLAEEVRRAREAISSLWFQAQWERFKGWASTHRIGIGVALTYTALLSVTLLLLRFSPLTVFRVAGGLRRFPAVELPKVLGSMELSLANLLVVGLFRHQSRVLDAWVAASTPQVMSRFRALATVREREIHVPAPIELDGEVIPTPSLTDFRLLFGRRRNVVLITAEGGAGKTSLACLLGRVAGSDLADVRLTDHAMLPVLLEHDLSSSVGSEALLKAITSQLTAALDAEQSLPESLVRVLLRKGRLLVIVDHFSEMSAVTRGMIRLDHADLDINCLIITSRRDEQLQGMPHQTVKPLRIKGERLSSFMEAYLLKRGQRDAFDDSEYFEYCQRLSEMVGDRDATVLLAKLYAEQMIAVKIGSVDSAPETVPGLILSYLNELNLNAPAGAPTNRDVQLAASLIARECLRETFRPIGANIDSVVNALEGRGFDATMVGYLAESLKLISVTGVESDTVRFSLDPVAEYLAAIDVTRQLGDQAEQWEPLLAKIDEADGSPDEIAGFLRALYDCVNETHPDRSVPESVVGEIADRAGLDPGVRRRAAEAQRVRMLVRQLTRDDEEDVVVAATFLGNMGPAAIGALPTLKHVRGTVNGEVADVIGATIDKIESPGPERVR